MYIVLAKVPGKLSNVEISDVLSSNKTKIPANLNVYSGSIDLMVYPNPFKNSCNVTFNIEKEGSVTIRLVDLSGRVIYTKRESLPKGKHNIVLNTTLTTGSYILHLVANDKVERTILIKQ